MTPFGGTGEPEKTSYASLPGVSLDNWRNIHAVEDKWKFLKASEEITRAKLADTPDDSQAVSEVPHAKCQAEPYRETRATQVAKWIPAMAKAWLSISGQ